MRTPCTAVDHFVHDSACRRVVPHSEPVGEVLQQRGLAVSRIAAQHDQTDPPLGDSGEKISLQIRLDVGIAGEVGVQSAGLLVAVTRARVGGKQLLEPRNLVRSSPWRGPWR